MSAVESVTPYRSANALPQSRTARYRATGKVICSNSQIAALVERQTRFVMLVKIASKDTETVINALIRHAGKLPHELCKSLTWDGGKEMADHQRFTVATNTKVCFCGVSRTQARACDAVSKMGEGLPKSACRSRLQTARCCCVQKARW
jgi:IS30 family transposase